MPSTQPNKHGSICWFECASTDVAVSKTFYTSLFDWTTEDKSMPGDHPGIYTMVRSGGIDVAGMYTLAGPMFEGVPSHWVSYIAVDDVDAIAERAKSLGGKVVAGPFDIPEIGRMAFLADSTGGNIAIFNSAGCAAKAYESTILGWIELHTPDTDAAETFYTELFGWTAKRDDNSHYTEFLVDGASIAGMMAIPKEQQAFVPANWLPYAMVEDCDAALARASELGATIIVPATDIPSVGRFAVFCDPAGGHLAMIRLDEGMSKS